MDGVRHFLLVLLLLGCRSQRTLVAAEPDAGATTEEAGVLPPDAPVAPQPDAATAPDAWILPALPDAPQLLDLLPDRPPVIDLGPALKCEQEGSYSACVDRGDGRNYFRRRDDRPCG